MNAHQATILGIPVSKLTIKEVEDLIFSQVSGKKQPPLFLVTAYSEFFLEAQKNQAFSLALQKANYILPDGISVLQAADYLALEKETIIQELIKGFQIGIKTLKGKYSARTTGVGLVKSLLDSKKYKIFLLGGWNGVAGKLSAKYNCDFLEGPASVTKATKAENNKILKAIQDLKPDILLVSFGRYNQEIWIAEHLDQLSAKVVIGVGSAFDEIVGEGKWAKKAPPFVNRFGLKWLWRVTVDPSHIRRLPHIPQFAWSVFIQKLHQ